MTATHLQPVGKALARYLARHWDKDVQLGAISQIPGGASRETYRVHITVEGVAEGVILRRDPPSSLIDTERAHEFNTYRAVFGTRVPVPEPLVLEDDDPGELERPFSLTREIAGCETSPATLTMAPFNAHREKIGHNKWTILGHLAALDVDTLPLAFMARHAHPARHELDYWAGVIRKDALHPQPIAEAAIRWLERHLPPPSARLALVHGDYRSGNFLYDTEGNVHGVLDWEMAHLGDPLEDLAWSFDPLWCWPEKHLAGNLLPRVDALGIWERASGLTVNREAFRWWQVFASLKALAIWISSAEDYVNGTTKEPILAFAGWPLIDRQNRILLDRLQPGSTHTYAEALL
ncbi:MAG: phosphotransferase family protein [Pseudomonadales bacterium]